MLVSVVDPAHEILQRNIQIYTAFMERVKTGMFMPTEEQKEYIEELKNRKLFEDSEYAKACRNEFEMKPVSHSIRYDHERL